MSALTTTDIPWTLVSYFINMWHLSLFRRKGLIRVLWLCFQRPCTWPLGAIDHVIRLDEGNTIFCRSFGNVSQAGIFFVIHWMKMISPCWKFAITLWLNNLLNEDDGIPFGYLSYWAVKFSNYGNPRWLCWLRADSNVIVVIDRGKMSKTTWLFGS